MIQNKLSKKRRFDTRNMQTRRSKENGQVAEESNIIFTDYNVEKPSQMKIIEAPTQEWHNPKERLRFQAEFERKKAWAQSYRNTPR